ncbi:MAG: ArdC family protein [Propionibacteriaceae bacterium]|jgi:hypothetical protein|nr:ArdC family protein [Propionibacteriaceae bacterium]
MGTLNVYTVVPEPRTLRNGKVTPWTTWVLRRNGRAIPEPVERGLSPRQEKLYQGKVTVTVKTPRPDQVERLHDGTVIRKLSTYTKATTMETVAHPWAAEGHDETRDYPATALRPEPLVTAYGFGDRRSLGGARAEQAHREQLERTASGGQTFAELAAAVNRAKPDTDEWHAARSVELAAQDAFAAMMERHAAILSTPAVVTTVGETTPMAGPGTGPVVVAQLEPVAVPDLVAAADGPVEAGEPLARDAFNPATGAVYQGKNQAALLLAMVEHGWVNPRFVTFLQALDNGCHVRKGEHGTLVVKVGYEVDTDTGDTAKFMRSYVVFNVAQLGGTIPGDWYDTDTEHDPSGIVAAMTDADTTYLDAMAHCGGRLLNDLGTAEQVDPRKLWTWTIRRARRYASPELLAHWAANPRPTKLELAGAAA